RTYHGWFIPDSGQRNRDSYDHFQAANTLRLEKQVQDWLFLSGGYLYSALEGDAGFNQESFIVSDPTVLPTPGEFSSLILLDQDSHVFNANAQLGPWEGLAFSTGLQAEWTRQDGLGSGTTPLYLAEMVVDLGGGMFQTNYVPGRLDFASSIDKGSVEEHLGLRLTSIPYTVVSLEGRLRQEGYDHYELNAINGRNGSGGDHDFLRETDSTVDWKEFRGGLTISPWHRASLTSAYKFIDSSTEYNQVRDADFGISSLGYPAFILARQMRTHEAELRLVLKLVSWLKTTLKYQYTSTDYTTETPAYALEEFDPATFMIVTRNFAQSEILAGNYDAHTYSFMVTGSPWRRIFLSGTFSWSQSRIRTGVNNDLSIVPYDGDVLTFLPSLTFQVNGSTSLQTSYAYSMADFRQRNEAAGLPVGIEYTRHGLLAGLTRQIRKNISSSLQYGFFQYDEPSSAGANDYTGHALFATLNVRIQ
ncbi:MAG: hypothetical protein AB1813_14265, partial [Verrucomicrobiota bacterium]